MRWLMRIGFVMFVIIAMFFAVIFFLVGGGQSAAACEPSTTAVQEGTVTVGSGPASDAYFAHFGSSLVLEKKTNAAHMIQLSRQAGLSDYSTSIVIATSLQESGLLNLTYGDRDSRGLFQQRPSAKVWGTPQEIMDTTHAINAFITAMKRNAPNRDSMPMIDVAIAVQNPSVSAYHRTWVWDQIATELVKGSSKQSCAVAGAHLPLDPGYHVSDGFDDPRDNMSIGSHPHIGIDLVYGSNTIGRPVYAAFSGVVVDSGYGNGCSGNNPVMIVSQDGLEAGYLHMNGANILVKKGDTVTAGQRIGAIGACGQVTGPHLHFEFTPNKDKEAWLGSVKTVQKFGMTWLDPVAVMAHFGVKLVP